MGHSEEIRRGKDRKIMRTNNQKIYKQHFSKHSNIKPTKLHKKKVFLDKETTHGPVWESSAGSDSIWRQREFWRGV